MPSTSTLLLPLLASFTAAHFEIRYPTPIGNGDATQAKSPCGGIDPSLSDPVDFHIAGDSISLASTHDRGNWLFRVTLDTDAGEDWEQIYPITRQSGVGAFCIPRVTVPEKYEGETGFISVVNSATDGVLYGVSENTSSLSCLTGEILCKARNNAN